MKTKSILFITHTYTTFQKSQIESMADYFEKIFVLVRYKPIAEVSRILPLRYLRLHQKRWAINVLNTPKNVHVYPIPINYFPFKSSYLKLGERLYKKSKRFIEKHSIKFDLIHAHYFWTSGYVALKLKQDYHTPIVVTNHSTHQLTKYLIRNSDWKQKMTETISGADHIFVVNNFMKERVHEIDINSQVDVIPAGFNEDLFYPIKKEIARKNLGLTNKDPIILNISSLDDNKNLELFIKGIVKVLPNYPKLCAFIIGDGQNFKKLRNMISQLGVEDHIKLMGAVPHQAVNQYINASDFVTLCSFIEGSPTVMYESLACGRPFLGSAVGGIPEIIHSSDYGCVFNPYLLDDFLDKIQFMLEQDWDEQKIINYSAQFSQQNLSLKILNVYQSLLGQELHK
jgi:glycosyltransferase involved in cell wall biosynthesis